MVVNLILEVLGFACEVITDGAFDMEHLTISTIVGLTQRNQYPPAIALLITIYGNT